MEERFKQRENKKNFSSLNISNEMYEEFLKKFLGHFILKSTKNEMFKYPKK